MLRLAWVSEIKPECCQDGWHSGCGFSKQEQGTGKEGKEIFSQQTIFWPLWFHCLGYFVWYLLKASC